MIMIGGCTTIIVARQEKNVFEKVPYLVFVGLRGTRTFAPARVLRQLGGKQELAQIANMRKFATDHENGRVAFAEDMHKMWK
ncbi:hypothetical protein EJD97_024265 [Solanum chilense]|uniref:Uncharacterized protein n=1 Tax=Solanum chilense TaxID=4083 RepID=A0A6N2CK59_SOLCI|nr:hypothetical protein EJD97_024265 [Solanum chilense]